MRSLRPTAKKSKTGRSRTLTPLPPLPVGEGWGEGGFSRRVLSVVRRIPRGRVMTYAAVARAADRPRAFRAVGNILSKNYDPSIPCHRVIRSDGRVGGYNRGRLRKISILKKEGVVFE